MFPCNLKDTHLNSEDFLCITNKELAHNLEWDYDATLVDTPILLISGAGGGDDWVQLQSIYSDINSNKVMLRRRNTPHNETLYAAALYIRFIYNL